MSNYDMTTWGFDDRFWAESALYPHFYVGRVVSQYNNLYKVVCAGGELLAEVSGKFSFHTTAPSHYPAVGDFVMMDRETGTNGNAIIHHVLSRKSAFVRKAAGTSHNEQIVASNIDKVFICMSLNSDFSLRRLERYMSVAWDSGAIPVIVLTKADICQNIPEIISEVNAVALGTEVLVTSGMDENGCTAVRDYLKPQETIAFIGSSGVGKSTLINRLLGEEKFSTQEIRSDDKGKHATTRRELVLLANGALVMDTPGMREIGLESAHVSKAFSDIDELSLMCKFNDCTHAGEPGCAVQEAIQKGTLAADRLSSYRKLQKELKYDNLSSRQIETEKWNEIIDSIGGMKNVRKLIKGKNKGSM